MSNPFQDFNLVYCLNLASRKDRWEICLENFAKYNVDNYTRFAATKVVNEGTEQLASRQLGQIGCVISFCRMIDDAIDKGYEQVVFLEDDFEFTLEPEEFNKELNKCVESLPRDWDMFYLGANVIDEFEDAPLNNFSENLLRLISGYALHSVAISRAGLLKIKNYFPDTSIHWSQQIVDQYQAIDVFFAHTFQKENNCYMPSEGLLALQRPDFSSIEDTFFDYNELMVERFYYFKSQLLNL